MNINNRWLDSSKNNINLNNNSKINNACASVKWSVKNITDTETGEKRTLFSLIELELAEIFLTLDDKEVECESPNKNIVGFSRSTIWDNKHFLRALMSSGPTKEFW